jgi:hypothetical protein
MSSNEKMRLSEKTFKCKQDAAREDAPADAVAAFAEKVCALLRRRRRANDNGRMNDQRIVDVEAERLERVAGELLERHLETRVMQNERCLQRIRQHAHARDPRPWCSTQQSLHRLSCLHTRLMARSLGEEQITGVIHVPVVINELGVQLHDQLIQRLRDVERLLVLLLRFACSQQRRM